MSEGFYREQVKARKLKLYLRNIKGNRFTVTERQKRALQRRIDRFAQSEGYVAGTIKCQLLSHVHVLSGLHVWAWAMPRVRLTRGQMLDRRMVDLQNGHDLELPRPCDCVNTA